MKQIRVLIERSSDGKYNAYMPDDNNLPFGLIEIGETAQAAEEDFCKSHEEMKVILTDAGKEHKEELEFVSHLMCHSHRSFTITNSHMKQT